MKWPLKGGEKDWNKNISVHFTLSLPAMMGSVSNPLLVHYCSATLTHTFTQRLLLSRRFHHHRLMLPILENYTWNHVVHTLLCLSSFIHEIHPMSLHLVLVCSFLLCDCTIHYFLILMLKDIWLASLPLRHVKS